MDTVDAVDTVDTGAPVAGPADGPRDGAPDGAWIVAIGGIDVRPGRRLVEFRMRAMRSLLQARDAEGCIAADAASRGLLHFSRSVWRDEDAMQAFARSGPHAKAMRRTARLATYWKFHHFRAAEVPPWDEAIDRWFEATGYRPADDDQ